MLQDLDMDDEYSAPLLKFTIARAVKQASRESLRNGKVNHLRVLLKSIVPGSRNTSAVLKDPTGEILCTIHRSVMEEHGQELQPGAVLILRQVTVFSPAARKHYLCVTPDNIVIIYPSVSSSTSTPPSASAKTICLTEIERRFRDQAAEQQSSPQCPPHPSSVSPQLSSTVTPPQLWPANYTGHSQQTTTTTPQRREEVTSWPSSVPVGPLSLPHHLTTSGDTHHPSLPQHSADSIFSDQLCEDEFDSIMGCIESELDF
jgi:hypothetical protein